MEYLNIIRDKLVRPGQVRLVSARPMSVEVDFGAADDKVCFVLNLYLKMFLNRMQHLTIERYEGGTDCVPETSRFFNLFGYRPGERLIVKDDQQIFFKIILT